MILFEKINERDVDLLIMHALSADPAFSDFFLSHLGLKGYHIIDIVHSLTDPELGESDITVIAVHDNARHAILIENKIDAAAQPNQYYRYWERGERNVRAGAYNTFSIIIIAPQSYLDTNPEAQQYPHQFAYERMLAFFEEQGAEFACAVLQKAIKKKETGYTVAEVPSITTFWQELYAYIQASRFNIDMRAALGAKGSRSTWVQFRTSLPGTSLFYKSKHGFVDLEFTGRSAESTQLRTQLLDYLEDEMTWEVTGFSLSLRIKTPAIDFRTPFSACTTDIDIVLSAVEKMTSFSAKLNKTGFTL